MAVYAIGDLHLSGAVDKPMAIFGAQWDDHWARISKDWAARVRDDDIVLLPGDISWAMSLEEAGIDLDEIGAMTGQKVMIKGNHDYWWSTISKVRKRLPPSLYAIQNDSIEIGGYIVCGTRGWNLPGTRGFDEHDRKIYLRELERLRLSLKHAGTDKRLIVMLHYPPFDEEGRPSDFVELIGQYSPMHVVYGHLHGESTRNAFEGLYKDTYYHLVSCDHLGCKLKLIE